MTGLHALRSVAERDRRWRLVREAMAAADVDLLVALPQPYPAEALYLAGEPAAVVFPVDDEPEVVLVGEDSHLRVDHPGWIARRTSASPHGSSRAPVGAAVATRLERYRGRVERLGLVGLSGSRFSNVRAAEGHLGHRAVERMAAALPEATVVDATAVVDQVRRVRSEPEVAAFRRAVELAEGAVDAIRSELVVGASQAAAYRAGLAALCEPEVTELHLAWAAGAWGTPRRRQVGAPPGRVDPGLCVAVEAFPGVHGYVAQVAHPFVVGSPDAQQREAFAANLEVLGATLAALRPGRRWGDVRAAAESRLEGTPWQLCFLVHCGPDGPLFLPNESDPELLEEEVHEAAVLVCKPHVYPRTEAAYVARSFDLAWGDTVVVRAGGAERLGTRPQELS